MMDTSALILTSLGTIVIFLVANFNQRKKRPLGEVSLIPYTLIQIVALVIFVVLVGHSISIVTGITFPTRSRY
jgi:hypothetical protein